MIIIIRFAKNNLSGTILIYINFGVGGEGLHGRPIFCLLFIKTEKVQEHDLYKYQILHFDFFKKILG